jgi:hypothetical protein
MPCVITVTSCPSGKRTSLSSTTTPSRTRPRATMGNLVQSGATIGTARILSRVTFDKKVSCFARCNSDLRRRGVWRWGLRGAEVAINGRGVLQ